MIGTQIFEGRWGIQGPGGERVTIEEAKALAEEAVADWNDPERVLVAKELVSAIETVTRRNADLDTESDLSERQWILFRQTLGADLDPNVGQAIEQYRETAEDEIGAAVSRFHARVSEIKDRV